MLQKVMRHGFEFWEAPRNTGPVFEDVDPEYQQQRERMRLRRMKLDELLKIVALAMCGCDDTAVEQEATEKTEPRDLNAKTAKSAQKRKYVGRRVDAYDRSVWGDLADLSDEEPVEILKAMGIPRDESAQQRDRVTEIDAIQKQAMREFEVTEKEFFAMNGRWEAVLARAVSMALCRAHTDATAPEIGAAHRREHTAVTYAVRRVARLRVEDAAAAAKIARIEADLFGGETEMKQAA